jgi:hypothetical protein
MLGPSSVLKSQVAPAAQDAVTSPSYTRRRPTTHYRASIRTVPDWVKRPPNRDKAAGARASADETCDVAKLVEAFVNRLARLSEDCGSEVDDLELPKPETVERAKKFLLALQRCQRAQDRPMFEPSLAPGPNHGVEAHWRCADSELLVHIPPDGDTISFYGDDGAGRSEIRGRLTSEGFYHVLTKFVG